MATSTISNTIKDASGAAVSGVTVVARLKPGPAFRISDASEVAGQVTTTSNGSGAWTLALEQTANITPANSWWEIEEQVPDTAGGRKTWAVQVGATNTTLLASLTSPPPAVAAVAALTQATGDARYVPQGVLVVSVKDAAYGAKGNNTADDAAAFQAAINAVAAGGGGIVAIPPGGYMLGSALSLPSTVALVGTVPRAATLKANSDIGAVSPSGWLGVVQVRDPAGAVQRINVSLVGVVIDANGQTHTPALTVQGAVNVVAVDCVFKGAGASAVANVLILGGTTGAGAGQNIDRVLFDRCELGSSSTHGLLFSGPSGGTVGAPTITDVTLRRCYVHDNASDGVAGYMQTQRTIQGVLLDGCRFKNNGTAATSSQNYGHVDDLSRNGWLDIEVRGCMFDQAGSNYCGGFSDHGGKNIKVHDNTFRLGVTTIWPVALGVNNTLATSKRTRFMWIEDNYFEGNNTFDYDSSTDIFIRRNVFYRVNGRPLGIFGDHLRNVIEDNSFIECGQGSPANAYEKAGISLGSGGVAVRRNVFVDEQGTPTMLSGVVEIAGGLLTGPVIYEDNDMAGVGTPLTEVATYDTVRIVKRNKGINPKGAIAVGLGASPYTYTAGESPETFMVRSSGGGVNITKGGVQIVANAADGAGTNTAAITLEPREQIVLTYPGVAPTCYTDVR